MTEEQMQELTRNLLSTTDAAMWADGFVKLHGGDWGLMVGWFANAIEVGREAGRTGVR